MTTDKDSKTAESMTARTTGWDAQTVQAGGGPVRSHLTVVTASGRAVPILPFVTAQQRVDARRGV